MKNRTFGFLSNEHISHDSEQFDYIRELHSYLWDFVRCELPYASGNLGDFIDVALSRAISRSLKNYASIESGIQTKNLNDDQPNNPK